MQAKTIDEVISFLDQIIEENKDQKNTMGYFAALYHKVTCKVKEGIENGFFDNNERMEQLDVIFANRYLQAYTEYRSLQTKSSSWGIAFKAHNRYWVTVLQHLLLGMNAHINLDLGIAAATVSQGHPIDDLRNDFNKINTILSELVEDVSNELAAIWPTLKKLLKWANNANTFLVNFSMELARDGAWRFAKDLAEKPEKEWEILIKTKDLHVNNKAALVLSPGFIAKVLFKIIRLGERGTVSEKISVLEK
jgi:hypothetical protein